MTRLTLVASNPAKADFDWRSERGPFAFVQTLAAASFALASTATDDTLDIARVIIDRSGGAEEFLELLARLPAEFLGDLVMIREDGSGYLSATGRGGQRVLYALSADDIRFYLEANELVTGRTALATRKTA